ncbi:prolyl 3-hydroxylase 1-like isoform X2 [Ptychodera flava]|uniref:prolyl 3-hydroxylase 1-like isoform X2 n=1 Tax=Ptychodera flava TaxID=63121 RepID=UPI00396A61DF
MLHLHLISHTVEQIYAMVLAFSLTFISLVLLTNGQYPLTYDELYSQGIQAYSSEDWQTCIESLENALNEFKLYRSVLTNCRLQCNRNISSLDSAGNDDPDLMFFDRVFKKAECLKKCKDEKLQARPERISEDVTKNFLQRVPYAYLQLAYFQTDEIIKAATATYTYLVTNPKDEMMQSNMNYYRDMIGSEADLLQDLELQLHQELYVKGRAAYRAENWPESIDYFEGALEEYYKSHDECQALCEGTHEHDDFEDLYISFATHYHTVLECQIKCEETLAIIDGYYHTDHVAAHYHYLQFAYYQVGEMDKAVACAVSYLLFVPGDEVMSKNMLFYEQLPDVDPAGFKPRSEARQYNTKIIVQRRMKRFADKMFGFSDNEEEAEYTKMSRETGEERKGDAEQFSMEIQNGEPEELAMENGKARYNNPELMQRSDDEQNLLSHFDMTNVNVILTEKELNGSERMAADGFATQKECETLMDLASEAQAGRVSSDAALSYLDLSERARQYVEAYFKLPSRLYFSYTHLVCRTAEPDSPRERQDLSHPIHADNCWLDEAGKCYKEPPAFTWRDYSAIMYLNSEFEGGEFIFAKFNKTIEASVEPKCGRLVSFSAGKENLHGVKAILEGRRCALALWFTLDKNHDEKDHLIARGILEKMHHDEL